MCKMIYFCESIYSTAGCQKLRHSFGIDVFLFINSIIICFAEVFLFIKSTIISLFVVITIYELCTSTDKSQL